MSRWRGWKDYSLQVSISPFNWRLFKWWGWGWGELQLGPVSVSVGWPNEDEGDA